MMMKNLYILTLLFGIFAFNTNAQVMSNCPAAPFPVTIAQPDGSQLTIVGHGTQQQHYTESIDGYTLITNTNGVYEYAVQTPEGGIQASGVKANEAIARKLDEKKFVSTLQNELRETPEYIALKSEKKLFKQLEGDGHIGEGIKPLTQSFPNLGKRKVLMLLIQYPDLKSKYGLQNFKDLMSKEGYGTAGSFRDFYMQNSFGKLDLDVDVFGWYTADSSYKFYGKNSGLQGAAAFLIAEAIDAAHKAGVDFSQYDNDGDGNVDGILVVHSGPGAEEGSQSQYIWSHRSSLWGKRRSYDGVYINDYIIQPETRGGVNTRMVGVGVFAHEFGHLLGLPDLYDVNYKSEGLGNWSLMAGGVWNDNEHTPACFDAWCKMHNEWITPVEINAAGVYTLTPAANDSQIYKINTPVPHEYYLLENKQWKGFDSKLPWHGLAIWHVNDSVLNRTLSNNLVNANIKRYGVALVQADNRRNLELNQNRGDNGDLFPGFTKNTTFNDGSRPSAQTMRGKSGINISEIKELPDSSVQFTFGPMPMARINIPTVICENDVIKMVNNSKFATSYEWNFGDGTTDTSFSPSYHYDKPGTYNVKLTIMSTQQSLSDSAVITVLPSAKASFTVTVDQLTINVVNNTLNASSQMWYWGDNKVGYSSDKLITRSYKDTGIYTIKMVALGSSGCNDTFSMTINVDGKAAPSKPDTTLSKVVLYPNPAHNSFNLKMDVTHNTVATIIMYDMTGRNLGELAQTSLIKGENLLTIEIPQLRAGIYMVEAKIDGQLYHFRLYKR